MPLRPHQVAHAAQIAAALAKHRSALDRSDTGTGKTYAALHIAKSLKVCPLVICPKSIIPSWQRVAREAGIEIETVNYDIARGRGKTLADGTRIPALTDYGAEMPWGSGSYWRWHHDIEFAIFDEVHRCGGLTSLNSKMLLAARKQFGQVLMLSATAANDPRQMYALGHTLGLFNKPDFRWWLLKHGCVPGRHGGFDFTDDPIEQAQVMAKLHHEIFPEHGAGLIKSEIPGFPKTVIETKMLVDYSGKAKKLRGEIERLYKIRRLQEAYAEEEDNHLTELLRARQALELLKVPDMAELATDYMQCAQVVCFLNFTQSIHALADKLKKFKPRIINGETPHSDRQAIIDAFQADERFPLICNNDAGGESANYHGKMERVTLISPGWRGQTLLQTFGRVNRDSGSFSQQFLLGFADTVEEQIFNRVIQRWHNHEVFNDAELNGIL